MKKSLERVLIILFTLGAIAWTIYYMQGRSVAVLDPKGAIAESQRDLIVTSTLLMLVVVLPVFALTCFIIWRYRADRARGKYEPEWDRGVLVEIVWWGVPCLIILVLGVLTWQSSHALDPFKPLEGGNKKSLHVQVVALDWKWLFLYPEQRVATINVLPLPVQQPIAFEITADAPMNSFWVPQLGGQIYAMPGMRTELHLIANEEGHFRGSSANLSGVGFAGMRFVVEVLSEEAFEKWVENVRATAKPLNEDLYKQLTQPSSDHAPAFYQLEDLHLFEAVIAKYMGGGM